MVLTIIFYVITFLCISKTVHDLNICSQLNTSLSLSLYIYIYIYIYVCMYVYVFDDKITFYRLYLAFEILSL